MKKLLMLCTLVMVFGVGQAMAANYAVTADDTGAGNPTKPFDSTATLAPGQQVTIDIYLEAASGPATAGGAWVDFSGSSSEIMYVSAGRALTDGSEGVTGPWDPLAGVIVNEPAGVGTLMIIVGNLGSAAPDGDGDIIVGRVVLQCTGAVPANINITTIPETATWGPNDNDAAVNAATVNPVLVVDQVCECTTDTDCAPGPDEFCTVPPNRTCSDCQCIGGDPLPCDTGNECTIKSCDEDTDTCGEEVCDESTLTGGATSPCCEDALCAENPICGAEVTLIKEDGYYQPPATPEDVVTIKNHICMDNPDVLVGGLQFDLCDTPDCLECINCELTERTTMFDCATIELPDGCCRVIMFCKNPGCSINPGLCNIVTVVMQTKEGAPAECGEDCIDESFTNIVASDYDGYLLASAGLSGQLCPIVCGDVCPPGTGTANDCGDGVVDIYDIMCEVDFALTATTPNSCQAPRADVPTGTPPNCNAPDGNIDILDVMVLIDMALNRQDCCSFYYLGIIY